MSTRVSTAIRPRRVILPAIMVGLLLSGCSSGSPSPYRAGAEQVIAATDRVPAPQVNGTLLDGSKFTLDAWTGKVVVINFWGSWCAPCRAEAPELRAVYEATRASGVEFLGVDIKDQRDLAVAFEAKFGIIYPSIFDPRGEVALGFKNFPTNAIPTTIVIDRAGRVAVIFPRPLREPDLRPVVEQLTKESG